MLETLQAYAQYLYDSSVVLVGGGTPPPEEELKPYDITVRLNNHWVASPGRMDVLYRRCATDQPLDKILDHESFHRTKLAWVIGESHGPEYARLRHECLTRAIPSLGFSSANPDPSVNWIRQLEAQLPRPLLGAIAAYHLTLQPIRELYITGMNLYEGNEEMKNSLHDLWAHAKWFRSFERHNPNVTLNQQFSLSISRLLSEERPTLVQ